MPRESHSGGRVVDKDDVHPLGPAKRIDFVARVVALGGTLEVLRRALEVRWAVAATNAPDADDILTVTEIHRGAVPQIEEPRQHFRTRLRVEPHEVLVIPFDEDRFPRGRAPLRDPCGKIT